MEDQIKVFGPRRTPTTLRLDGTPHELTVEAEYKEFEGRKGVFGLTCHGYYIDQPDYMACGGADHKRIVETFPELAPYVKWHLCSLGNGEVLKNAGSHLWAPSKENPEEFRSAMESLGFAVARD